jgi:predicted RNA-binding Zn ribbon-like protein
MPSLPTSPPAPGEDRSVALALVNTEIVSRGDRVDLLADGRALARWLCRHGLPTDRAAAIGSSDLQRVRELRTAIRQAFTACTEGERPSAGALRRINSAAALVPRGSRLSWNGDGPAGRTVWPAGAAKLDIALAAIGQDAIATLLGETGARLRACEAHGCIRLFIQEHARRRWCSTTCGDRVRVARHYRKVHGPH